MTALATPGFSEAVREFEYQLSTPTPCRLQELIKMGTLSSHNLLQTLIANQDLLRLRKDMWPDHRTTRKEWWFRAYSTAINRKCTSCNRLWTTEKFPPSQIKCNSCLHKGTRRKPTQFKAKENETGLIFRSTLPEELKLGNRADDAALSLDTIKRCLYNMLEAFARDIPQSLTGSPLPLTWTTQEITRAQEPPWLWFTIPELGFPMIIVEYHRQIHPEVENFLRRYISDEQDWDAPDDEDCWGSEYISPSKDMAHSS